MVIRPNAPTTSPLLDLGRQHAFVRREINEAIESVIDCSRFIGNQASRDFELAFAALSERSRAVGCGSRLDALTMALLAAGVGPGDEVIVPAMGSVDPAAAVVRTGATPVIVDVDPTTLLLSEDEVDAARTPDTRAVVAVHLYGHIVPFDQLARLASSGLDVIEDATDAPLATWNGAAVGSLSRATALGFPTDGVLGAFGEAGAVLTDDHDLAGDVVALRNRGFLTEAEQAYLGFASGLDGVQAAVLDVKLRHVEQWIATRRRLAERYRDRLGARLVPWQDGAVHSHVVLCCSHRDEVARDLIAAGVPVSRPDPVAVSQQLALAAWARPCSVAENAASEVLGLPISPLMTDSDVDDVCDALQSALR